MDNQFFSFFFTFPICQINRQERENSKNLSTLYHIFFSFDRINHKNAILLVKNKEVITNNNNKNIERLFLNGHFPLNQMR